ncbi:MAG TPA: cytochrome c-type biogenesis protein [Casimicrobiaceae bacterium]|nr:cytochrome c-type biogenesis protein [Casimicrobiaceae bacterium]
MLRQLLIVLFSTLLAAPSLAVQPSEMLPDPQLEQRARGISQHLRCMVCQNQSIDDSDAPLAKDLRLLVRERVKAGDSDPQIIDYMVARYGEFVLLKPRFSWHTVGLWVTPAIIILVGGLGVLIAVRRRRSLAPAAAAPPLTQAEQQKLAELAKAEKT